MAVLHLSRAVPGHEDVFVQRYDALLRIALRLTDGDRAAAEDLVHDTFVRFVLVRPPLGEIQQLDAYLHVMLRNVHTSRVRRAARAGEAQLSVFDCDAAAFALDALDPREWIAAKEALREACAYGLERRWDAPMASVFLLRFFHGYLPSEIAAIARVSAAQVDKWIWRARREVKLRTARPWRPDAPAPAPAPAPARARRPLRVASPVPLPPTPPRATEFLDELRHLAFSEAHARCVRPRAVRRWYDEQAPAPLPTRTLAEVVGCPACLETVSRLLGLASLSERHPPDSPQLGRRSGGSSARPPAPRVAAGLRLARTIFEHRPRELRIAVNGFVVGTQTVGLEPACLTLTVNLAEPIQWVELFSEQELCLLFLPVTPPPDGAVTQTARVALSGDRAAALTLTYADAWPALKVEYQRVQASLGPEISFGPRSGASLRIVARADSDARRDLLTGALGDLATHPAVRIELPRSTQRQINIVDTLSFATGAHLIKVGHRLSAPRAVVRGTRLPSEHRVPQRSVGPQRRRGFGEPVAHPERASPLSQHLDVCARHVASHAAADTRSRRALGTESGPR